MNIDGACHCGRIAYEAAIDPDAVSICHCTDCQQLTGTIYRVTVSVPVTDFHLTRGSPKTYVKMGDNGAIRYQMFCPECGSPLYTTGEGEDENEIGIRWGSIRQRRDLKPRHRIWCASGADWAGDIGQLPGRPAD